MKWFRNNLAVILKLLARLTIKKFDPGIIGITGSVGKTSAKSAVATVLQATRRVQVGPESLNNEFGLPLAILGGWSESDIKLVSKMEGAGGRRIQKAFFWSKIIVKSIFRLIFLTRSHYPELLVLEYGAQGPGDIKYLLSIARPQIGVLTAIGETPVHVENYPNIEALYKEKGRILESLQSTGVAIVNADDNVVFAMRERTRAHVMSFGFSQQAEMRITHFENIVEDGRPRGIAFKLNYGGNIVPIRIDGVFGKSAAYAAAIAACTGIAFGIHLVRIEEALKLYQHPEHRMHLMPGIKETWILDDAYNASPLSTEAAIEAVHDIPTPRKIAVLGDMLELGEYAIPAHQNLGKKAAKTFDVLITVGPRAKFIAESARVSGMNKKNVMSFDVADEARIPLQDLLKKGDLVLIKASRGIGLETLVEEIKLQ